MAPEIDDLYVTDEKMEAQRGPHRTANTRQSRDGAQAQRSLQPGSPLCLLYLSSVFYCHGFYQSLSPHQLNSAFCNSLGAGILDFCQSIEIQV